MTEGDARELLALLPLRAGSRVVVRGIDPSVSLAVGRVESVDGDGIVRVALIGGGVVEVDAERVRRACGECADCRALHYRPRCADH
jgi:hypothetical protein